MLDDLTYEVEAFHWECQRIELENRIDAIHEDLQRKKEVESLLKDENQKVDLYSLVSKGAS